MRTHTWIDGPGSGSLHAMATERQMLHEIDRQDKLISKIKDKAKEGAEAGIIAGATLGGAAVAGLADGKYPKKKIAGLKPSEAGAAVFLATGVLGLAGKKYSKILVATGLGMGSGAVYARTFVKGANSRTDVEQDGGAVQGLPRGNSASELQRSLNLMRNAG